MKIDIIFDLMKIDIITVARPSPSGGLGSGAVSEDRQGHLVLLFNVQRLFGLKVQNVRLDMLDI